MNFSSKADGHSLVAPLWMRSVPTILPYSQRNSIGSQSDADDDSASESEFEAESEVSVSSSSEDDHNNRSESESSGGPSPESSSPDLCLNNMLQRKIPQRVLRPHLKRMSLSSPKHSQ